MNRKLATIRSISAIQPIPGADSIEVASVDGWKVVVKKGEFGVGQEAIYFEIDSFLPVRPEFEFLRKSSYRKLPDDAEGFRLRTVKLRGQVSQGLLLPVPLFSELIGCTVGRDVTDLLCVRKWDPPIPTELAGEVRGPFPSRIPKTDEERIQNMPEILASDKTFTVTEKLDGSSATFYWDQGRFGVCSRNWDLADTETNSLWKWARAQQLAEKLGNLGRNIAIQGEFVGPGVQGNLYKLPKTEVRLFNGFDMDTHSHLTSHELTTLASQLGLPMVPVLEAGKALADFPDVDAILAYADGLSALNAKTIREGVVFRCEGETRKISFKAISNRFLLSEA